MNIEQRHELYKRTFIIDPDGALVLRDLVARFYDKEVFVPGGLEGARKTDYQAGQRAAIGYILKQLGQVVDKNGEQDAT